MNFILMTSSSFENNGHRVENSNCGFAYCWIKYLKQMLIGFLIEDSYLKYLSSSFQKFCLLHLFGSYKFLYHSEILHVSLYVVVFY